MLRVSADECHDTTASNFRFQPPAAGGSPRRLNRRVDIEKPRMLACCGAEQHLWEAFAVAATWSPDALRCLIVGESPGENPEKYFYNERRKVALRTIMLGGLHRHGLLTEPTLAAFRKAGFLFDHAIRCLLHADVIQHEAGLADRYVSLRAATATHLGPSLGRDSRVWVMGRIARNAVAVLRAEVPRDTSAISKPPNPRWLPESPRFFLSRYLLHASLAERAQILARLHLGLEENRATRCLACLKTS
jgi:hypothetical protein